jgi:hypothetical protein
VIELLPVFFGVLCGLTLRRLAFGDFRLLLVTLGLGALCSILAEELTESWAYILIDWMTVYGSCVLARQIVSGVVGLWRSREQGHGRVINR